MQNQQLKRKAYSYIRFSTPEQSKGDSYRRQTDLAKRYADLNDLQLQNVTFKDLGKSAYDGTNSELGALSVFLDAVSDGSIPSDSYLLVESLDRISRQSARKAAGVLGDICDAGITVVTLSDNKVYTKDSLDEFGFLYAILIFIRANEESLTKSRRGKSTWTKKREDAVNFGKPLTNLLPAWLYIKDGVIVVDRHRARLIKYIFRKFLSGVGYSSIASEFNDHGIKTWGNGKFWHRTYIRKILQSPSVIGIYTPCVTVRSGVVKNRVPQSPILGYFPSIIDDNDFYLVQSILTTSLSKSSNQQNIFATLARCPLCKSTLTRKSYGSNPRSGSPALICTNARVKAGCDFRPLKLAKIEQFFIKYIRPILTQIPFSLVFIDRYHDTLVADIKDIDNRLSNLSLMLQVEPSHTLYASVLELEKARALKSVDLDNIEHDMYASSSEVMLHKRSMVIDYFNNYDGNAAFANMHLKSLINCIYFHDDHCQIFWKNNHDTLEFYSAYSSLENMGVDYNTFWDKIL